MSETQVFQRLERAIGLIAGHPFYPGKQEALEDCLDDLEERYRQGTLTEDEKTRLVAILVAPGSLKTLSGMRVTGAGVKDAP